MSKIWFVTGANSGIGAGIVQAALDAGDRVVATGRNIEKLRAAFPKKHEGLALIELDVTKREQADRAVAGAIDRFGRIDVVVNNAGFCVLGNFEDLSSVDFERQLATNFFGVVHVMHAVLPVLRKQQAGHIFNISSVAGAVGMAHCSAYSASKFALEGLSMAVSAEVERFGIKITTVEPGYFRTKFLAADNANLVDTDIDDYAGKGAVRANYVTYDGHQLGDPLKLGHALLQIATMQAPPTLFVAGSDAVGMVQPAVEARLRAVTGNLDLSCSTDGDRQ